MTAERFRQIRNVFDAAMDQAAEDRAAWLAAACEGDEPLRAEVEELLRQHQKRSGVLDGPAAAIEELAAGQRLEGRRIGPWEILREIGRGGMGAVYLARRADGAFQMSAAVKVLNVPFAGDETRKRFRQEREILAQLSHPNIARLLDGGTTEDGLPYLVMEFVEGQPLTEWADERRASIGDRLELLGELCRVVDYLHRNNVIHRDLKPANVLVDKNGALKLLDFGISKLLAPVGEQSMLATRSGLHLLTPEYASPEQVTGEPITTQTDIYALGVIAYELLSGHRPYSLRSRAMHAILRAICEEEPERPSTVVTQREEGAGSAEIEPGTVARLRQSSPERLSQRLRGDLDEVVMKALRKEPARRYRSAGELDRDLAAHRDGQPVVAHGESLFRQLFKLLGRYRVAVFLAIAAILLIASGAVTIHAAAITYGLSALGLICLWNSGRDPGIVRQISKLVTTRTGVYLSILLMVAAVYATVRYIPVSKAAIITIAALLILLSVRALVRWIFRERWSGKLLVDASIKMPRWYRWWNRSFFVLICASVIFAWPTVSSPSLFLTVQLLFCALMSASSVMSGKLEIRQRGIVGHGILYTWDDIEAWSWASGVKGWLFRNNAALRLELRNTGLFRRSGSVPVSRLKVDEVSNVMNRFLGEWPGDHGVAGSDINPERPAVRLQRRTVYFGLGAIALFWLAAYAGTHEMQLNRSLSRPRMALWQSHASVSRNAIDGLDYAWIPAGSFMMGCSLDDDQCEPNEKPAHQVTITHGFWIGTTEVTDSAYRRFIKARNGRNTKDDENPDLPAVWVTWAGAQQYCEWAKMRLPTEAEWEYAARAGTTGSRYGLLADITEREGNEPATAWAPYPVGRKQPNAWGLYDVLGNVREWVADRYAEDYYSLRVDRDPMGPSTGEDRVVRGGGHRVSERGNWDPQIKDHVGGFRCAGQLQ